MLSDLDFVHLGRAGPANRPSSRPGTAPSTKARCASPTSATSSSRPAPATRRPASSSCKAAATRTARSSSSASCCSPKPGPGPRPRLHASAGADGVSRPRRAPLLARREGAQRARAGAVPQRRFRRRRALARERAHRRRLRLADRDVACSSTSTRRWWSAGAGSFEGDAGAACTRRPASRGAARAELWAFVTAARGPCAPTQLDSRYRRVLGDAPGGNGAGQVPGQTDRTDSLLLWLEIAPEVRALGPVLREAAQAHAWTRNCSRPSSPSNRASMPKRCRRAARWADADHAGQRRPLCNAGRTEAAGRHAFARCAHQRAHRCAHAGRPDAPLRRDRRGAAA